MGRETGNEDHKGDKGGPLEEEVTAGRPTEVLIWLEVAGG